MAVGERDIAADIVNLFEQLSGNRGTWEGHWEEIARRIYTDHARYFRNRQVDLTKGDKRTEELFDSTGAIALNRFAAILDSLLTPRNQTWHRVLSSDAELNKDRSVRLWFDDVNALLFKHRYSPKANFASQNQLNFKSLGAFGSGALYIDALDDIHGEKGLRYKNCHLGEIYFMENHQGVIDTVIRHFSMTARQAVQKWGPERVPDKINTAMGDNENQEFYFLHFVGPNPTVDPSRVDFRGMPFISYYVSITEKQLIDTGGYGTMPYATSRYEQAPNEVYGRSPAMEVLPAIKTLNEQKKTLLKQGHRAVDPVLLVHDDGVLDSFSLRPGAINAGGVSKDGRPLVHTLQTGNVQVGKDLMDDERQIINDTFLVTIFQILAETPAMTATEVMERTREKGILLAPTLGRQQSERLGPQIEREVDVLSQLGILPPLPPILEEAGAGFKIEYDSPLSRSQRAEEASGLMRTVEATMNVVNVTQDPSPLDHFNWDVIVPELSDINAVPAKWRNGPNAIAQIRNARAKQAQKQQAIEAAPAAVGLAKTLK